MANYYITGVWKAAGVITSVMLHNVDYSNNLLLGKKTAEQSAIALIEAGHNIKTLKWDYSKGWWSTGASVTVVQLGLKKFLRTSKDATVTDNLDNLILMNHIC